MGENYDLTYDYYYYLLYNLGNLYIADVLYSAIRKVVISTGIISTIAGTAGTGSDGYSGDGGQATAAKLNFPSGLTVDSSGIPLLFAPPLGLL